MSNKNNNDNNNKITKATVRASSMTTQVKEAHQEKKRKIVEIFEDIKDIHEQRFGTPNYIPKVASKLPNYKEDNKNTKIVDLTKGIEIEVETTEEEKALSEKDPLIELANKTLDYLFDTRDIVTLFSNKKNKKVAIIRSAEEEDECTKRIEAIEAQ